uniref:Uncharacterized protein n=2 Tax=Anguilla anguilla TaxID=7936 RepID=A0A0E9TUE3_ANGAN
MKQKSSVSDVMRCEAESDAEAEINIDDTDGVRRVAVSQKYRD